MNSIKIYQKNQSNTLIILKNILIVGRYNDFGPTLAQEKLAEEHGLKLSVESVRKLMLEHGLWDSKRRKTVRVHQQRMRRPCRGELIQIDGSHHHWFETRADACCLYVFIDDATGELMSLHLAEQETAAGYFSGMRSYLLKHGRPVGLYSDKHGIFKVNIKEAKGGTGETQFGRAMRELDIDLTCANTPQAKGRVEKANRTLQDRLVKELRLNNISDIPTANEFLPKFIAKFNKKFAVKPASSVDAHRLSIPSAEQLDQILSWKHQRRVSKNLELSYNNVIYQIQSKAVHSLRGSNVIICDKEGEITILYKGKSLSYKAFDKKNRSVKVMDRKQVVNREYESITKKPTIKNEPWRHPLLSSKNLWLQN